MNDTELDLMLDTWEAPAPPPSLREDLRARFPEVERRRFPRPLRWVLAIAIASAMLVIGMEQSGESVWGSRLIQHVNHLYAHFMEALEVRRASSIRDQIQQSAPKVYVNGQLAAPLEYGHAATMYVHVPGDGVYSFISYTPGLNGWVEAGRIHGNVVDFRAGSSQVRIECNQPIVDSDRPVFARRLP
jgi:hypothetical protein